MKRYWPANKDTMYVLIKLTQSKAEKSRLETGASADAHEVRKGDIEDESEPAVSHTLEKRM